MNQADNMPALPADVMARVDAVEARWGKSFMEVMLDIHDHLFGVSPVQQEAPADAPVEGGAGSEAGGVAGNTENTPVDTDDAGEDSGASGEGQSGA